MVLVKLVLFTLPFTLSLSNFPIVSTNYGSVRGYEYRVESGFVGEIFKKIPYATPPIGSRRWKKPIPPERWNYTLDGTFFGPACPQVSTWKGLVTGFSEDCLTLNIYTLRECRESNSTCPVVLYIRGGNAVGGGPMKFPDEIMINNFPRQGVTMVTIAYRLGVFGVMALGDENVLPANLAIHDCLEGLRFIRKEIHNFGGDKNQISLMGDSTGATIVSILAFSDEINSPNGISLFNRAISMSFSPFLETEETQVDRSHAVAKKLGCMGTAQEIVDCLLPLSTDEIISAVSIVAKESLKQLQDITSAGEIVPIRDVRELVTLNKKPIKLMLGSTLNEMGRQETTPPDKRRHHVNAIIGLKNDEECYQKYLSDLESGKFVPDYAGISQAVFMSTMILAKAQSQIGGEVYLYQYDYPKNSFHSVDNNYIMGSKELPKDENIEWLSLVYPVYFTNFIKGLPLAPDWKPMDSDLMNYYSINKNFTSKISPKMKFGYHQNIYDYFEEMIKFDDSLTKMKRMILNSPIEYKQLYILSTESMSLLDILICSTFLLIILFAVFNLYRFCHRQHRNVEKIPLLADRLI